MVEEFARKLILWGGRRVIKEYSAFRDLGFRLAGESDALLLLSFEKVLFEIRRDLGHSNRGLRQGDLLSLYIEPQSLKSALDSLDK